jgi:hypothetical protein
MQILTKQGNTVTFRGQELTYISCVKLDDNMIHANFETQTILFFVDDTQLNGIVYSNSDELINALNK